MSNLQIPVGKSFSGRAIDELPLPAVGASITLPGDTQLNCTSARLIIGNDPAERIFWVPVTDAPFIILNQVMNFRVIADASPSTAQRYVVCLV